MSTLALELALGRPQVDDRLGHAEDWHTDRARFVVHHALRRTDGRFHIELRTTAGVTVPIEDLTSAPETVGVGGSAAIGVGSDRVQLFAFATVGRPGTAGRHGSAGVGGRAVRGSWVHVLSYWSGYTLDHEMIGAHRLWGLQATLARRVDDRWSVYGTLGILQAPRTFPVSGDVSAQPGMHSIGVGLQHRFGAAATADEELEWDDPWLRYQDPAD